MLVIALLAAALIAVADQLIKNQIVANFRLYEERTFLQIGSLDILHLHYIQNNGSAFSSFAGMTVFLLILTGVGIAACLYFLFRKSKNRPLLMWSLSMILGGAVGNLIDRIFRGGAVVDYLDVQLFNFAIFNFADCFITVGTAILAVYIIFFLEKDDKRLGVSKQTEKTAEPEETDGDT